MTPPSEGRTDEIRREVKDKLSVAILAHGNPIPMQRSIVLKQCEDFLVEMVAAAEARAEAAEREQEKWKATHARCESEGRICNQDGGVCWGACCVAVCNAHAESAERITDLQAQLTEAERERDRMTRIAKICGEQANRVTAKLMEAERAQQALRAAAETALTEMCNTVAPRNSFTDAVDALSAALTGSPSDPGGETNADSSK